jgi:pre-mRNA-splicing factor CWC22
MRKKAPVPVKFLSKFYSRNCLEYMGLAKLNERVKETTLQVVFGGLFPRDYPKDTRFSISLFISIGLGGLTDELTSEVTAKISSCTSVACESW